MPSITSDGDPHRAARGTQEDTDTTRMPNADHPSRTITTQLTLPFAECDWNPVLSVPFYTFQNYTHCVMCHHGNKLYAVSVSQRDSLLAFITPTQEPARCVLHRHETSFIPQTALRQVHTVFASKFFTQSDLVLPLSIYSILSFSYGHPVAAYVFFFVFPSLLSLLQ
jgi:hypothetical protein